jgi:MFS transporter, CP family, cyanate transporter
LTNMIEQRSGLLEFWFRVVLLLAMALPMLVLYATSTLSLILSNALNFPLAWLGYVVMSSFGLASLLSLWAGQLVNRIGSRIGLMSLFMIIALAFTVMITAQNFNALLAAAALCGIAQALANPVTNLLIAEQLAPTKRAAAIGVKQSGVQISALFAGLVLPSIALHYGWKTALGLIIPVALLLVLTTPFIAPKKIPVPPKPFKLSLPNTLLVGLMSVQFCVGLGLSAFVTFLPTFATHQGLSHAVAGSLIAVFGVMGIVSRIVLTPLGAKMREEAYLLLGLCLIAALSVAITMQANPDNQWVLWLGAIGVGLTAVATNAIAMSMLVRDSTFGVVAVASGLVSVAFFGGFALGAPLYAYVTHFNSPFPLGWLAVIGVFLIACRLALALANSRYRHRIEIQQLTELTALKNELALVKEQLTTIENVKA